MFEKERLLLRMKQMRQASKQMPLFWKVVLNWNNLQFAVGLILIVLTAFSPAVIKSDYYLNIIILTVLYAFVGLAWNIVGGYAGLLLFGFIPFFGLGAYTTVILLNHFLITPWVGILIGMFPAALLALLIAFLTLRYGLKEDYFLLFTMAVMVVLALVFSKLKIAGGAIGISVSFVQDSFERMAFIEKAPYVYISLALLLIGLVVNFLVARSKLGRYLVAIRENEDGAKALGVNVSRYKTFALLISAMLNALAGGFYMIYTTFIEPPLVFGGPFNFELLIAPIIGGRGSVLGPILGAILNKPMVELVRGYFSISRAGTTLMIYGLFLMVFILFLPRGVIGLVERPYRRFRQRILAGMKKAQKSAVNQTDAE